MTFNYVCVSHDVKLYYESDYHPLILHLNLDLNLVSIALPR